MKRRYNTLLCLLLAFFALALPRFAHAEVTSLDKLLADYQARCEQATDPLCNEEDINQILGAFTTMRDGLATGEIDPSSLQLFNSKSTKCFMDCLSIKKTFETSALVELLSKRLLSQVESGSLGNSSELFSQILTLRQDPSAENDALRMQIATSAKSSEAQGFARGRISELTVSGRLANLDKLRLFVNGWYDLGFVLNIVLCIVAVIAVIFVILLFRALVLRTVGVARKATDAVRLRAEGTAAAKKSGSGNEVEADADEYTRCLMVLGLDDDVSGADIKDRYRKLMLQLHPDAGTGEPSDEFLEVKKAYNRAMQIRSGWFGGKNS